jgi:hypothetical protein
MSHKVLLIASLEYSRRAALEISEGLREYGYAPLIAHAKEDDESKISSDISLSGVGDMGAFSGVVFLDDGGDSKRCEQICEDANKQDKMIAGYGLGCVVLASAGALVDKYVCQAMEGVEGAKIVDSPSVRCDNIVTCIPGCSAGFVVLLIDALGGEIKNVIHSSAGTELPPRSALVISKTERWPEYWGLARKLHASGVVLAMANWNDVDIENRDVKSCIVLDVPAMDIRRLVSQPLPKSIWFKQTSIGLEESIDAVASLESIGCRNVNSSAAMRGMSDKAAFAKAIADICDQGDPLVFDGTAAQKASKVLVSIGTRWVKPLSSSLGRGVMRVQGRGQTAIVSRRRAGKAVHVVTDEDGLTGLLRHAYNHGKFMVQEDLGSMHVGDRNFELRFVMRRNAEGWRPSSEIARAGTLISNPAPNAIGPGPAAIDAPSIMKIIFPSDWEMRLDKARRMAEAACVAFQSSMERPQDVNEIGIDMTFKDGEPRVIEGNSVPDLTFVDAASFGIPALRALAQAIGTNIPAQQEVAPSSESRSGVAPAMLSNVDDDTHARLLQREMGLYGIWLQPNGRIAVRGADGTEVKTLDEVIGETRQEAAKAVNEQIDLMESDADEKSQGRAATISKRVRHKLRLLEEMRRLREAGVIKSAGVYDSTVSGPYSNLDLPYSERVFEYKDGDDWLTDREKAISDLPRYNPEYDDYGFYYVWYEPQRSPYEWRQRMTDGVYPMRANLQKG